ncbi:hypothetical protein [Streptomyces virginiae]|nr:hypothetical protein [Streptomyces virginiae]
MLVSAGDGGLDGDIGRIRYLTARERFSARDRFDLYLARAIDPG